MYICTCIYIYIYIYPCPRQQPTERRPTAGGVELARPAPERIEGAPIIITMIITTITIIVTITIIITIIITYYLLSLWLRRHHGATGGLESRRCPSPPAPAPACCCMLVVLHLRTCYKSVKFCKCLVNHGNATVCPRPPERAEGRSAHRLVDVSRLQDALHAAARHARIRSHFGGA